MKHIPIKAISFSRNPYNGSLMSYSVALFYFKRKFKIFRCSLFFHH